MSVQEQLNHRSKPSGSFIILISKIRYRVWGGRGPNKQIEARYNYWYFYNCAVSGFDFINYFFRLLTTEEMRRCVKEKLVMERSKVFDPEMRMLIPPQYPKVWGEQRAGNKVGMVSELIGYRHRINTGRDEKCMSLYLRRVSPDGLDCPSVLTQEEFLPAKAPLLDFLVEDTKRNDAWKYPKLEELEKYQKFRGLNLSMLDRIETRELVCGVSSISEIREVRDWIERMQERDQRDFGTQVVSLDVEDVKATYYDTLKMAGLVSIRSEDAVIHRKCDPEILHGYSKDVFKQIPGKIMFGNGISWTCLISLDLRRDSRENYLLEKMSVQPEIIDLLRDLPVSAGLAIRRDVRGVEEFYSLISGEEVRIERGFIDLTSLAILAGYKFQSRNMTAMGVQVLGTLLNKTVSTGDDYWGVRWQQIPGSLRCYALGDIMFGFVCYNVLAGILLRDVFPDPDVVCRYLRCNQKTAADWFLDLILMTLEGVEFHQGVEESAVTREEMILSLRYRDERDKLADFSPPMVRLWTSMLGNWPSPTCGGCRYLLQARDWFIQQMEVLAEARVRWSSGKVLKSPVEEDRIYSRFNLSLEEVSDEVWKNPVEGIRGLKRPEVISLRLLCMDISRIKSKEIGRLCTEVGRSHRWSLLEWGRMYPSELPKFFLRMENYEGFRRFYRSLYDAMRLLHLRVLDKRAPVVEVVEKELKMTVGNSLMEEQEGLRKSEEETERRRKRVAWLEKLASDWEYEERSRWKEETPALNPSKKRSGVKRKSVSRPGKLKRLRMRSLRDSGVGSSAGESASTSLGQPVPGSSGARNGSGEEVSEPQQEASFEEVVVVEEDDDVFLEEKEEQLRKEKRMSAAPGVVRRVVDRPPTYDELIESVPRSVFSDEEEMELEVPWEDRLF